MEGPRSAALGFAELPAAAATTAHRKRRRVQPVWPSNSGGDDHEGPPAAPDTGDTSWAGPGGKRRRVASPDMGAAESQAAPAESDAEMARRLAQEERDLHEAQMEADAELARQLAQEQNPTATATATAADGSTVHLVDDSPASPTGGQAAESPSHGQPETPPIHVDDSSQEQQLHDSRPATPEVFYDASSTPSPDVAPPSPAGSEPFWEPLWPAPEAAAAASSASAAAAPPGAAAVDDLELARRLAAEEEALAAARRDQAARDEAMARALAEQAEAERPRHAATSAEDAAAAKRLHEQELEAMREEASRVAVDGLQAQAFQTLFDKENQTAKRARIHREAQAMRMSTDGRATLFAQAVHGLTIPVQANCKAGPVAKDDMVFMAKKVLAAQERLMHEGSPYAITVAYHWTKSAGIGAIRTHGLLSAPERSAAGVKSGFSGAAFGNGVYVSTHPTNFRLFGDTCLMCAVLRGRETRVTMQDVARRRNEGYHTVIGNKTQGFNFGGRGFGRGRTPATSGQDLSHDEIVLSGSEHVIPVFAITGMPPPSAQCALRHALLGLIATHLTVRPKAEAGAACDFAQGEGSDGDELYFDTVL